MIQAVSILCCTFLFTSLISPVYAADEVKTEKEIKKIQKEKDGIRAMRSEVLKELYETKPATRAEVEDSEAVAVFSSMGINLFLISTGRGGGVVKETKSGKETFMRMVSVGGGFGLGVKDFKVIMIFHTKSAAASFMNSGWDLSGQGDVAAKAGDEGVATNVEATIVDGVTLYQITENGLALQATLQGTKYYKDDDLNND